MKKFFTVLSLSCFVCFNLLSLDFNISGEFGAYIINAFEDMEYNGTSTQFQNDLNFSIFSENNSRLAMQLLTGAKLFSANNSVLADMNQLFIQFPVKDFSVFYIGKKVVNLGFSRKFSLFNRINPETINALSSSFAGSGIIEFDAFYNDFLNFQTLLYYGDFNRTDTPDTFSFENLSGLLKYDLYHYPFTFSALLYAEGFRDFPFGLSCSFQLFNGIFYLDYLYSSSVLFGARYNLPGAVTLNYEYLYNGNNFSNNNLSKHNMFLALTWNPSFFLPLTIGSQFQLWASSFIDAEYVGLVFSPYMGYSFYQNLSGGLSVRFPIGEPSGLSVLGIRRQTDVMLELRLRY